MKEIVYIETTIVSYLMARLLKWNCRHLANAHVLRRLQKEAEKHGWQLPGVCTPLELMGDCDP